MDTEYDTSAMTGKSNLGVNTVMVIIHLVNLLKLKCKQIESRLILLPNVTQ